MNYAEILINIRKISRAVNLESKRLEKEHGISIPQLLALTFLKGQANYQASHKAIKDFLKLNASTVTGIISRLEKKGMIAKLPRLNDRRVSLITLTAKGAKILESTPYPLHHQISDKRESLSKEELQKLTDAFHAINDILNIDTSEENAEELS